MLDRMTDSSYTRETRNEYFTCYEQMQIRLQSSWSMWNNLTWCSNSFRDVVDFLVCCVHFKSISVFILINYETSLIVINCDNISFLFPFRCTICRPITMGSYVSGNIVKDVKVSVLLRLQQVVELVSCSTLVPYLVNIYIPGLNIYILLLHFSVLPSTFPFILRISACPSFVSSLRLLYIPHMATDNVSYKTEKRATLSLSNSSLLKLSIGTERTHSTVRKYLVQHKPKTLTFP